MATQNKPLSVKSNNASLSRRDTSMAELQAEYRQRQRSERPLPASIARAYEVLIAREEPEQQAAKGPNNGQSHSATS